MTPDVALDTATLIHERNPRHITEAVLSSFESKLGEADVGAGQE